MHMAPQDKIEVERRRKGSTPAGRAEAPQRETGGGQYGGGSDLPPGGGFPSGGGPSRGRQIGGCGSILLVIAVIAIYIFSKGQIDLTGGGSDQPLTQAPYVEQPSQSESSSAPVSNFTPPVPASGAGQTWTVMLYQDADDEILEKDIFMDFNEAERVGSSDNVRIVAQIDRFAGA